MAIESARENFWSRRLRAVKAEARIEAAEAARREAEADRDLREARSAEKTDDEILVELGLTDPDKLQAGDDFSAFMHSAVPERLRRRALRSLWRSNPLLANLDGLVDHGDDFSDAATVRPGMKTAYQIGRGMMEHVAALERQARDEHVTTGTEAFEEGAVQADSAVDPRMPDEARAPTPNDAVAEDARVAAPREVMTGQDLGENGIATEGAAVEDQALDAPRPRHMRFLFDA